MHQTAIEAAVSAILGTVLPCTGPQGESLSASLSGMYISAHFPRSQGWVRTMVDEGGGETRFGVQPLQDDCDTIVRSKDLISKMHHV